MRFGPVELNVFLFVLCYPQLCILFKCPSGSKQNYLDDTMSPVNSFRSFHCFPVALQSTSSFLTTFSQCDQKSYRHIDCTHMVMPPYIKSKYGQLFDEQVRSISIFLLFCKN